ncbi:uncharacterized protein LOC143174659 isoform X2 [Nomia melanderi]|uniref:uncharacterized protein LOC143174659 isoform X2 n=1 Tax=Nomia melanderi TaxID=2448451 RepID=UPI003FCE636C
MSFENKNRDRVSNAKRYEYVEDIKDVSQVTSTSNVVQVDKKTKKKKVTIEVDEDDPCLKDKEKQEIIPQMTRAPGADPRSRIECMHLV